MDQKALTPFDAMRREVDRMFDAFSNGELFGALPAALAGSNGFLTPKINVCETDAGLEVTAELPGIDQKEIDLSLDDGVLTLNAEHASQKEEKDEKKHYHLVERAQGTFLRRIALPFEPDADRVEATFDKGILKVTVPKSAKAGEKIRKIQVKGT
jgi:HSP20 family protein